MTIAGNATYVYNINNNDYTGNVDIEGGVFPQDPTTFSNVTIKPGREVKKLSSAPAGAPSSSYVYMIDVHDINNFQTDGTGYFRLSSADGNTAMKVHVKLYNIKKGKNGIFGNLGTGSVLGDMFGVYVDGTDNTFHFGAGSQEFTSPANLAQAEQDYYITLKSGYFEVDTVSDGSSHIYHHSFPVSSFHATSQPVYVGACYDGDTNPATQMAIYDITRYNGTTVTCEYLPAKKVSDGSYCLYDKYGSGYLDFNGSSSGHINDCTDGMHTAYYVSNDVRKCVICSAEKALDTTKEPYISLNGTSYFDSQYLASTYTKVKMHFIYHNAKSGYKENQLFGYVNETNKNNFFINIKEGNLVRGYKENLNQSFSNRKLTDGQEYTLTMSGRGIIITCGEADNDTIVNYQSNTSTMNASGNIYIGKINNTPTNNPATIDLFSCQIYEKDELKQNYVPSVKDYDVGFLDLVDKTASAFHYLEGNGATYPSSLKPQTPCYVRTFGTTNKSSDISYCSYVTDVHPSDNMKLKGHFKLFSGGSGTATLFGCDQDTMQFACTYSQNSSSTNISIVTKDKSRSTQTLTSSQTLSTDEDCYIELEKNGDNVTLTLYDNHRRKVCTDTQVMNNVSWAMTDSTLCIAKCAANANANANANRLQLYDLTVHNDGKMVGYFIPYRYDRSSTPYIMNVVNHFMVTPDDTHDADTEYGSDWLSIGTCLEHKFFDYDDDNVQSGGREKICLACKETVLDKGDFIRTNQESFTTDFTPTSDTKIQMHYRLRDAGSAECISTQIFGSDNFALNFDATEGNMAMIAKVGGKENRIPVKYIGNKIDYYVTLSNDSLTLSLANDTTYNILKEPLTSGTSASSNPVVIGAADLEVCDITMYKAGVLQRHYIPMQNNHKIFGLFETITQTSDTIQGLSGYVNNCEGEMTYYDISSETKDGVTKWYKRCRICNSSRYELSEAEMDGRYIRTYIDGTPVNLGDSIRTDSYGDVVVRLIPSRYEGQLRYYDAIGKTFKAIEGNGQTAYIPECNYHQYCITYQADGKYHKHCYICDKDYVVNALAITSKDMFETIEQSGSGHTYYIDMVANNTLQQYVAMKYPSFYNTAYIFEQASMLEGKILHYYLPGRFNDKYGVYDVLKDTFIVVNGSQALIDDCWDHKYTRTEKVDGTIFKHCYICDKVWRDGNYRTIIFNSGNSKATGTMGDQVIIMSGALKKNSFRYSEHLFRNWKQQGKDVYYDDGATVYATEDDHNDITLIAQWDDAFTYNDTTMAITEENCKDIRIIDDGKNGFATSRTFTGNYYSYTRPIIKSIKTGTACLPFAVNDTENPNMEMYQATRIEKLESGPEDIYLNQIHSVEPGVPFFYKLKDESDVLFIEHTGNEAVATEALQGGASLVLKGSFSYDPLDCRGNKQYDFYATADDHFYNVQSSIILKPYHAYLYKAKTASTAAKLTFRFGSEELTGINDIKDAQLIIPSGIYDVMGRKLDKMQKGINIIKMPDGTVRQILVK